MRNRGGSSASKRTALGHGYCVGTGGGGAAFGEIGAMGNRESGMESTGETVIVRPRDRLSVVEGQEILASVFSEVRSLPRDVIIDLSVVHDISSWGFALVCGLARKLALMGHRLRIAGPTPFVRKYLEMFASPVEPVEFHDSREDALSHIWGSEGPET